VSCLTDCIYFGCAAQGYDCRAAFGINLPWIRCGPEISVAESRSLHVFVEKGGWGVFAGKSSYLVDGVEVGRWLPSAFCTLLYTFCGVSVGAEGAKAKTGLAFICPTLDGKSARQGWGARLLLRA
jgi:hypothetical protein